MMFDIVLFRILISQICCLHTNHIPASINNLQNHKKAVKGWRSVRSLECGIFKPYTP